MRIFLIGYMGAGKTTVGRQLSKRLDLPFYDLDQVIEESEGQRVADIFERNGEAGFRGVERNTLQRMIDTHPRMVLSTGGGTPCFYDNLKVMKEQGTTVYLKMDVGSLAHRLMHSKSERPLIKDLGEDDLRDFIKRHLEERREIYEDADIVFEALGMGAAKLDKLVGVLK